MHAANLSRAYLEDANLSRAHLEDARLTGAGLPGTNLSGAHISDANLTGAVFPPRSEARYPYVARIAGLSTLMIPNGDAGFSFFTKEVTFRVGCNAGSTRVGSSGVERAAS